MMSWRSPLAQSALIHGLLGAPFLLILFFSKQPQPLPQKIKVEIKEVIKPKELATEKPLDIQTVAQPKPAQATKTEPRKIFGINKNTLTDNSKGDAVGIKAGNTIAKEIDNEKMRPEDEQSLPIPTEEYLISKMPKLKSEIRIPYPPEARKNNIEGLVVLEILIDENGKVRSAELIEGPGFGLNEAALSAIYSFEFSPAFVDEKPVAVKIRYGYRFVLN